MAEDHIRPLGELMSSGLLWLINKSVFHPRGFALAIVLNDDKIVVGYQLLGDGTEPWSFSGEDDDQKFKAVEALLQKR